MCILGLLFGVHPDIPFLCCHNRDEVFTRPVHHPYEAQRIVFGRDISGGGTWLGLNRDSGLFVALTNVARKKDAPHGAHSRGQLVMRLLDGTGPLSIEVIRAAVAGRPVGSPTELEGASVDLGAPYAGFNIIVAMISDKTECYFLTNRPVAKEGHPHEVITVGGAGPTQHLSVLPLTLAAVWRLPQGMHALSNSTLNDESWLKVKWLRAQLPTTMHDVPTLGELTSGSRTPMSKDEANRALLLEVLRRVVPVMLVFSATYHVALVPNYQAAMVFVS